MPSDLHATYTTWPISNVLPLLTPIEFDHDYLSLSVREVRLPGLQSSNNFTGAPKQGRKVSDGAIVFEGGDWEQERVVLETGFSQDMEDLRRDKMIGYADPPV